MTKLSKSYGFIIVFWDSNNVGYENNTRRCGVKIHELAFDLIRHFANVYIREIIDSLIIKIAERRYYQTELEEQHRNLLRIFFVQSHSRGCVDWPVGLN